MKIYEKPVVLVNEELAEGVYAASGSVGGSDCFVIIPSIHQAPELGRDDYRIQFDAQHDAVDNHHSATQVLIITFNQPVKYVSCNDSNATLTSGDGTSTLEVTYNYHQNGHESIGLGDLVVEAGENLAVTGATLTCDHKCAYNHSW